MSDHTNPNTESTGTLFELDDQVALVTGGAGGLGRSIAVGLASAGATVVIADNDLDGADEIMREIEVRGQGGLALPMDVTDSQLVQTAVDRVCSELGRIDVLVTSHGVATRAPTEEFAEEQWDRIIDVNLKGVFLCCQIVGKVMLRQEHGSIINLASIGGLIALPTSAPYSASKGGVVQLTRALGVEWARMGVRVNVIAPSTFNTPLVRQLMEPEPDYRNVMLSKVPSGLIPEPEALVGAILYLASPASSMVTGTVLPVDGGYTAQ